MQLACRFAERRWNGQREKDRVREWESEREYNREREVRRIERDKERGETGSTEEKRTKRKIKDERYNMPQSPSNKLFNERLRKMFEIIFVQFWHTRERATSSSLYLCTTFNYYKFSILLQTMIDFVWKCIWLFLRLTIKCCQSFFTRYIYIHISLKCLIYLSIAALTFFQCAPSKIIAVFLW